jgi:hypothetical protein
MVCTRSFISLGVPISCEALSLRRVRLLEDCTYSRWRLVDDARFARRIGQYPHRLLRRRPDPRECLMILERTRHAGERVDLLVLGGLQCLLA